MRRLARVIVRAPLLALPLLAPPARVEAQGTPATPVAQPSAALRPGHPRAVPSAVASRRAGAITVDGAIDDAGWRNAPEIAGFRQYFPDNGKDGTERTVVRIVHDDDAIYVAARMFDRQPVRSRLVRRDADPQSDYFHVIFDTYHDHLGRALFQVNPSGSRTDMASVSTGGFDPSWDPVWEWGARIDSLGWTAEMRIPLSQLRYATKPEQTWGLQLRRYIQRNNEEQLWSHWTQTEAGGPQLFGHLDSLRLPPRGRRVELMPYVVDRLAYVRPGAPPRPGAPANPFNDGSENSLRVGADVKALLGSNLTLDVAVLPDFGQVEVDPAVVNLSQFENFFPERRPFFIEGAGLFGFGSFSCFFCSNVSSLSAFYSRRIGRAPQGQAGGTYVDRPQNTDIIGAAKVTGRTQGGWSVGLLNAVTGREDAEIVNVGADNSITRRRVEVEPASNYFVGRVRRDLRGGDLVLGAIGTSVFRSLDDAALAGRLTRRAELLGTDGQYWMKGRQYRLMWSLAASQVTGSPEAMQRVQLSPARYFQRPDSRSGARAFDPGRTSLAGYAGYARMAKDAGNWIWETAVNLRSPGFEVNDMAFLTRADYTWMNANVFRVFRKPTAWYRTLDIGAGAQQEVNWDGDLTDRQMHAFLGTQTLGFWNARAFYIRRVPTMDDRLTRGGPVVGRTGHDFVSLGATSDTRKSVWVEGSAEQGWRIGDEGQFRGIRSTVTMRPTSWVNLSVGPSWNDSFDPAQYVTEFADSGDAAFGGRRYLFAQIRQKQLSLDTRAAVTMTPTLTFELFAQPLVASGDYVRFREFTGPRERTQRALGPGEIESFTAADGSRRYRVYRRSAPGVAAEAATFGEQDFNFRSLRGNAVLRWEYRPGSTLFLVWTQQRQDAVADGDFDFSRDRRALVRAQPDNVFLVKLSYWLGGSF